VDYSGVNAFRIWAAQSYYEPADDLSPWGDGVKDLASFNARKALLRASPESTTYINWPAFNTRFATFVQTGTNHVVLNYMLGELRARNIAVIATVQRSGSQPWTSWGDRWEHWQHHYALAYHMARYYDVQMFQMYNEPDLTDDTISQDEYIERLQFASDAIRSAIQDVNARYAKALVPQVLAPVITHASSSTGDNHMDADPDSDPRDDVYGWGQKSMMSIRTDYQKTTVGYDIFDVFDTHKYGKVGTDFAYELGMLRTKMQAYSPAKQPLPVIYSEFNRQNTSSFADSSSDLDTPSVFCDIAGIYHHAMLNGVNGLIAFKFSNTVSSTYGAMKTGFHYVSDTSPYPIGGARKGAEVVRLVARNFAGGRDLLETMVTGDSSYLACTVRPPSGEELCILASNPLSVGCPVLLDLSALPVRPGAAVWVQEVSPACQGSVVAEPEVLPGRTVSLAQPAQSVWLIRVPLRSNLVRFEFAATADAVVRGGTYADTMLGTAGGLGIRNGATATDRQVSYLRFPLGGLPAGEVRRAVVRVRGRNVTDAASFICHVYGINADTWNESTVTWNNAPNLAASEARVEEVGTTAFPVGHLSVAGTASDGRVDVTEFVRAQADGAASFVLARETRFTGDTDTREVSLESRESAGSSPVLEVWAATPAADFDIDGDVDQEDFAHMQRCYTDAPGIPAGCEDADLVGDVTRQVDTSDVAAFLSCMEGPNVVVTDPACY
jgi:hypothetical protein